MLRATQENPTAIHIALCRGCAKMTAYNNMLIHTKQYTCMLSYIISMKMNLKQSMQASKETNLLSFFHEPPLVAALIVFIPLSVHVRTFSAFCIALNYNLDKQLFKSNGTEHNLNSSTTEPTLSTSHLHSIHSIVMHSLTR